MIDVSVAYNRYKFLGYEFLTWLWFAIDNNSDVFDEDQQLEIGNRIVLEKNHGKNRVENITIKGDDAGLEEGGLSLKKGAVVTEINLVYKKDEKSWQFTIKGESMHITNLKTPEYGPLESEEDIEGTVLLKISLIEEIVEFIEKLFAKFVKQRTSEKWGEKSLPLINKWINSIA